MTSRLTHAIVVVVLAASSVAAQAPTADLTTSISRLSAFDYSTRMNAARALRRMPSSDVAAALREAARSHPDQFVRARALVLFTGFRDPSTPQVMQSLVRDRNDRVREIVYRWYEEHPESSAVAGLLAALETEQAEFVRPALIRALTATGENAAVQRALLGETTRGLDFFRSAVIETLGRHRAGYAADALTRIAAVDGPLQDDAILALGRIGNRDALPLIKELSLAAAAVPVRHAALCRLQEDCPGQIAALAATLRNTTAAPAVTRAAASALAAIAEGGNDAALGALFTLAGATSGRVRDEVSVGFASVAVQRPEPTVTWIERLPEAQRPAAMDVLRSGFELLEEDYAEEQFFAAVRAAYWAAAEGSGTRTVAASLIERLDF